MLIPIIGVLLGLALASKWVAAYAIGGFLLLMLLRSGLGRLIALAGMIGLTAVLGALAIRPAGRARPASQLAVPGHHAAAHPGPRGSHRPTTRCD